MSRKEQTEGPDLKHQSNLQRLADTNIHDWYRFVFAYSDKIISDLVDDFGIGEEDLLLDPFNGTGTTTLAAKKLGIDAIGTDASPAAVLAGKAKTNWEIDLDEFRQRRNDFLNTIEPPLREIGSEGNTTLDTFSSETQEVSLEEYDFTYPEKLSNKWLSEKPFKKTVVVDHHIEEMPDDEITDLFRLALIAILPEDIANVGFGPEVYKVSAKEDVDVYNLIDNKLDKMEADIQRVQEAREEGYEFGDTEVFNVDARTIKEELEEDSTLLFSDKHEGEVDYVITSPPYPAEHDYTRNQRLELVWMGVLEDNKDLRKIKERNIRSNTKNIYVDDDDGEQTNIRENERIDEIVTEMERIIEEEDIQHGFGQYYPRVIEEYFGGMQRHFEQLYDLMAPGGKAAYVVADQASYWQVEVPTGQILGEIAEERVGFEKEEIKLWRNVAATTGKQEELREEILVLQKPK